jgi:DNA-binding CsgD family transcriptional regulator
MEAIHTLKVAATRPVCSFERMDELPSDFLLRLLDEIDYGLVVVSATGKVQHANHLARHELARGTLLTVEADRSVVGSCAEITEQLTIAIQGGLRGKRRLLYLSHGDDTLPVAVIPLSPAFDHLATSVLLVMARQHLGDNLALQMFAREHGLTPTEESVLRALCDGREVDEIAHEHGVAESTVRTQVRSLRDKTGTNGIRQLVQRVLGLPPVVPALRANAGFRRAA